MTEAVWSKLVIESGELSAKLGSRVYVGHMESLHGCASFSESDDDFIWDEQPAEEVTCDMLSDLSVRIVTAIR